MCLSSLVAPGRSEASPRAPRDVLARARVSLVVSLSGFLSFVAPPRDERADVRFRGSNRRGRRRARGRRVGEPRGRGRVARPRPDGVEVLAKHSSTLPLYQMSFDGGRRAVMTLVRSPYPRRSPTPAYATPLPSELAVSRPRLHLQLPALPPRRPRVVFGAIVSHPDRGGPAPKMPRCGSSLSPSPSNASTAERPRPPPRYAAPNAYAPPLPTSDTPPRTRRDRHRDARRPRQDA